MTDPSIRLRNAIKEDNYFIASRLLKRFPGLLDNIDPSNGWSNLHYSAYHNNYQISELLLKGIHNRFVSTSIKFAEQDSPAKPKSSAIYSQITDEDEIKLTFEKQTVLHVACLGDAAATLNLLLSYFNVCLDQRDKQGHTPSHICCTQGFPDCLSILLEKGAYPNIQDNNGDTLLHKAFQYSNVKCLELLIKYNADDQLLNNVGWKPADVAFNTDIIQEYKTLKCSASASTVNRIPTDTVLAAKTPQTKYAPVKVTQNNVSCISFIPSNHNSSTANYPPRINLPSIQPRKYSLSSMLSDEYVDRFDPHDDARSSSSSKNSRTSSPTGFSSNHPFVPRKTPPTGAHESNHQITNKRYPQPPAISSSISSNGQGSTVSSPRRSNASNHSMQESPTSKRSSLSTRTFRSNSQLSEISPMKGEHPQLVQQSTGSTAIKSGSSTPRHSFQGGYRPNSSYPVPLQVEEASSKLHDLKLKNVDRLKLDTKLGNIINNTSQENLVASPTASQYHGGSSAMDNNDNKSTSLDLSKRSKILSIPILSSRGRHNT